VTARTALRSATVAVTTALVLLSSTPAFAAANPDDGGESGPGLSVLETLLIFVGIPAALFLAIVVLVSAPSRARGPRYRPGLGWWAAPVWFNGPDDADTAVRTASATAGGGGASARW
jgi:hypothetical protein